MPVIKQTESWVKAFRQQVSETCGANWQVVEQRGRIRLKVQGPNGGSVMLPYEWSIKGSSDALGRIRQIRKNFGNGETITLAAAATDTAVQSSNHKADFDKLFAKYRSERKRINDDTWKHKHLPVLTRARTLLESNNPAKDGYDLMLAALDKWESGTRQRQIMRQNLSAFLTWAADRKHLKPIYRPVELEEMAVKAKRIGYPLTDAQILRLLDSLPDNPAGRRWRFAIQLCATAGLRPEDLRHLVVKQGADGPELWSMYEKSKGGKKGERTKPRRLNLLLVRDLDGTPQDWNLVQRLQIGEELPPMGANTKVSMSMWKYLSCKPVWKDICAEAERAGEEATCYSFRHRFVRESHQKGIPIANIAASCGHSIQTHLTSYARFAPSQTAELYATANA